MKETKLTDKKVIKALKKDGYIEIECVCISCLHGLIDEIIHTFNEPIDFEIIPLAGIFYAVNISRFPAMFEKLKAEDEEE